MEINGKLVANELRKAALLITRASILGMDCSGYGGLDVNATSGNVYLWLEDYNFCLYIAPSGGDVIMACYSCIYDGEETIRRAGKSLPALEKWAERLYAKSELKEIRS